jgi:hypothetical protein
VAADGLYLYCSSFDFDIADKETCDLEEWSVGNVDFGQKVV